MKRKLNSKINTTGLIIYGIIFVLLNLVIFAIFKPGELKDNDLKVIFWFSYAFIVIAFGFQIVAFFTGRLEEGVESIFFGFPMLTVSAFYFGVATILSLAFMILVALGVHVPFLLMFVLEVLVLGVYAIAFVVSLAHKNVVLEIDKTIKHNVIAIRNLVTDVEFLAESVTDAQLKAKLNRLAEDIRYSDPMTNNIVAEIDLQIKDCIAELEVYVTNGDFADAEGKIKQTQLLVSKRNKRLADSK